MKKAVKKGRKNFDKRPLEMKYAKNKPPMAVTKRNERERTRVHIVNQVTQKSFLLRRNGQ